MSSRAGRTKRRSWVAWLGTLVSVGLMIGSLIAAVQPIGATSGGSQQLRTIQFKKEWNIDSSDGIGVPTGPVTLQVTTSQGTTSVTCSGTGTTWNCSPTVQAAVGTTVTISEPSPPVGWEPDSRDLSFKVPTSGSGTIIHTVKNKPVTRKLDFQKQWLDGSPPNQNLQLQVTVDDPGSGSLKSYNITCSKSSSATWNCNDISKVQVGSSVTIVEQNLPSDWDPVSGTLSLTMPAGSGTYTHTIQNRARQTGGGGEPGGGGGQAGTTLSAQFRNVVGTYGSSYDWTIEKTVPPESLTIPKGASEDVTFTITVTRSEGASTAQVTGELCVTNGGERDTQGLQIVFYVDNPPDTTWLANTTDTPSEQIPAGQTRCYPFSLTFTPVSGDLSYRVGAKVTITNHSGHLGDPFGPNPKESFSLTSSGTIDESATVTDSLECPAGFSCDPESVGPWTVTQSSWSQDVTISVTNNTVCSERVQLTNTATLTDSDSGRQSSDSATATITAPDCETEPQTVNIRVEKTWIGETPPGGSVTLEASWQDQEDGPVTLTLTCTPPSSGTAWDCGTLENVLIGTDLTIKEPNPPTGWEFVGPKTVTVSQNTTSITVTNQLRTYLVQFHKQWEDSIETPDTGSVTLTVTVNGESTTVNCYADYGEWYCLGSVSVQLGDVVTIEESLSEDLQGEWEPDANTLSWTADEQTLAQCQDDTCTHVVVNRPVPQVQYEIRFEKRWVGGTPPNADAAGSFVITVTSEEETLTCTWDGSALGCDHETLTLFPGETYGVSESGMPQGWTAVSGVGEGFDPARLDTCELQEENNTRVYICTHTVVNQWQGTPTTPTGTPPATPPTTPVGTPEGTPPPTPPGTPPSTPPATPPGTPPSTPASTPVSEAAGATATPTPVSEALPATATPPTTPAAAPQVLPKTGGTGGGLLIGLLTALGTLLAAMGVALELRRRAAAR